MKANLDSSVITSQDVSFFAPTLKDWFETYTVSGRFAGTVDNFTIKKMKVFTGTNSYFARQFGQSITDNKRSEKPDYLKQIPVT